MNLIAFKKSQLVVFLIFMQYACVNTNHKEETDKQTRKWYYADGTLKKTIQIDSNGRENGVYTFYFPNGVLNDSAIITNGKFHGMRYLYYQNGKLHKLTKYMNHKFRDGITYDSLGMLSYYRAYDYLENLLFIIEYDSLNHLIKRIGGNYLYSCILNDSVYDSQPFEMLVATPPKQSVSVKVFVSHKGLGDSYFKLKVIPDFFNVSPPKNSTV